MAISILQERESSVSAAVSSLALAFSSSLTSGSSLHLFGTADSAATSISSADSLNGTHGAALDSLVDPSGPTRVSHFKFDGSAAGASTVTITPNTSQPFCGILIREIGGTSGYDGVHPSNFQGTAPGTATDAVTSGTGTPSVQPGLISALSGSFNATTAVEPATAGTGMSMGIRAWTFGGAFPTAAMSESKRYTATTAIAATFTATQTGDLFITLAAFFKEASGGAVAPQYFGEDAEIAYGTDEEVFDESWVIDVASSAPVGFNQPPLPQPDETFIFWWDDYDDPEVNDLQWSGPVQPNAPPAPIHDESDLFEDDIGEDSESWIFGDSQPVGPNAFTGTPPADAFDYDEDHTDDWEWFDSAAVSSTVSQPPLFDDPWPYDEDHTDDWNEESAPIGPDQPARPAEDAYPWDDPEEWLDEQPDDDGFNVRNASNIPLPGNGPEDAWPWDDPEDYTDDIWDDDGSNVQNQNVLPVIIPPIPPVVGALLPGVAGKPPKRKPLTALELEGHEPFPWQATGAPIVPSPYMGASESIVPIASVAPPADQMFPVKQIIAPTEDEALLLLMLLGASL